MAMTFEYNVSLLKTSRPHGHSIRSDHSIPSDKELAEVFEDSGSQFHLLIDGKYPIIAATGFTRKTKPLKIAFTRIDGTIIFLDARIASKTELIEEFVLILNKLTNAYSRVT